MNTPSTQMLISNIFSIKRRKGSLEKWLTLGFEMNLGYLIVPKQKEDAQGMTGLCPKGLQQSV